MSNIFEKLKKSPEQRLTLTALADATGMDRKTIKKRLVDAGLYPPDLYPKEQVIEAIKPAVDEFASIEKKLKAKILYENWRKLKRLNDVEEQKLIEIVEVQKYVNEFASRLKMLLQNKLINEYPAAVAGLNVAEAREFGRILYEEIFDEIQRWTEKTNVAGDNTASIPDTQTPKDL